MYPHRLLRMDYVDNHPFSKIKSLRLHDKIVQPFSQQDITTLLQARFLTPYLAARNRAIVLLLMDTGIRLNELVCLNIEDLDRQSQRLRILQGKGNKQRVVRVGDRALLALVSYIDEHRGQEVGRLSLSDEGGPMSRNSVRVMLERLGRRMGITKVYPHRFRTHSLPGLSSMRQGRSTFSTSWAIQRQRWSGDIQRRITPNKLPERPRSGAWWT